MPSGEIAVDKDADAITRYLNVDLNIYSKFDLQPLVSAMGKRVSILHVERQKRTYFTRLEPAKPHKDADSAIRAFCALIDALPKDARDIWNAAKVREFNIGVQGKAKPTSFKLVLSSKTVTAAANLNARIIVTIYGRLKETAIRYVS